MFTKKSLGVAIVSAICITTIHLEAQKNANTGFYHEVVYKIAGSDTLKAYIFYPQDFNDSKGKPAVVSFHGGGWAIGSASITFNLSEDFAKKGIVGISAQYRLSDQTQITPLDAMEDAKDLIIWLKRNSKELFLDPDKLVAYGWSAGGHLGACTAVFPKFDSVNNISSMPSALILYTSALSVINDRWFELLLIGKGIPIDYSPAENLKDNMPPSLIIAARNDSITPVHESELFHENMIKYKNVSYLHIYNGVAHLLSHSEKDFSPDVEVRAKAFREIDLFLEKLGYLQ